MGSITYADDRYNADELYHYGVKGMRWGVRRYQNEDGSYTKAGKKRNLQNIRKLYGKNEYRLGGAVGKDAMVTSAADKMMSITRRMSKAHDREREIYRIIENEDNKAFDSFIKKNKRYPDSDEIDAISDKTFAKYKKELSLAKKEINKIDMEYDLAIKNIVDDCLGKYGNKRVNGIRGDAKTAEDWLKTQIKWGNMMRINS